MSGDWEQEQEAIDEAVAAYHHHQVEGQCSNVLRQWVQAPLPLVWSIVRRFDSPQAYKCFIRSCKLSSGDGGVGSTRDVTLVSGLPASCSRERLDILDEEHHVLSFSVLGGEHRLHNYRSVTTLHQPRSRPQDTIVLESYVVDVPPGNSRDETITFTDTVVRCNLQSLAKVCEHLAVEQSMSRAARSMSLDDSTANTSSIIGSRSSSSSSSGSSSS